jgi:fumarate hydratase class II
VALIASASRRLADGAVAGFEVRQAILRRSLERNAMLVTALTPLIGYELGATIARRALEEDRPVLEVARELTQLEETELRRLLDPLNLTRQGGSR